MLQDQVERLLPERTGRHRCIVCLKETAAGEYFANDHACADCADRDQAFPLASTPDSSSDPGRPEPDSAGAAKAGRKVIV